MTAQAELTSTFPNPFETPLSVLIQAKQMTHDELELSQSTTGFLGFGCVSENYAGIEILYVENCKRDLRETCFTGPSV